MRFGSLFSGIGGLDLGLERAGMTCVWQVEIDNYATRVLEKHWPGVKRYRDIKTVNNPEQVDIICGGFPCQDISVAGKGRGLAGERSGLWREYLRIVEELRPAHVLIENVPALRTRGLQTVLNDLRACGYDAEWDGFAACAFGAPHKRDRLFVVAHSDSERRGAKRTFEGRSLRYEDGDKAASTSGRTHLESGSSWSSHWAVEPELGRVAHGIPSRVDRLRGLGNAVVPQVAEYVGRLIMESV